MYESAKQVYKKRKNTIKIKIRYTKPDKDCRPKNEKENETTKICNDWIEYNYRKNR